MDIDLHEIQYNGFINNSNWFSSLLNALKNLMIVKMEMNDMATIIPGSKVYQQMFRCFNCGRKTVSLGNVIFMNEFTFQGQIEDDDLDEREFLEELTDQQIEWLATCKHCGWSDS